MTYRWEVKRRGGWGESFFTGLRGSFETPTLAVEAMVGPYYLTAASSFDYRLIRSDGREILRASFDPFVLEEGR
jgi:hypothetical protein